MSKPQKDDPKTTSSEENDGGDSVLHHGSPEDKINAWLTLFRNDDGHLKVGDWMESLVPHITLHSVSDAPPHPRVTLSYTVQPSHCNRMRNLHGGCVASIFDFCTTLPIALVCKPGFWMYLGVSRTLHFTYIRPAAAGEELLVECEIVHIGKNMASLKGIMRRKRDGAITAMCEHDKANVDPGPKM